MSKLSQLLKSLCLCMVMASLIACTATSVPTQGRADADREFGAFIESYWTEVLAENPFLASIAGVRDYDHRLNDLSLSGHERQMRKLRDWRAKLEAFEAAPLSDANRINFLVLKELMDRDLRLAAFDGHLMPISTINGWHLAFARLSGIMPFNTAQHYGNYLSRLEATDTAVEQGIEVLEAGIAAGMVQPCRPLQGVDKTFLLYVSEQPEDNMLYGPFKKMPSTIPVATQQQLRERAAATLNNVVAPAFRRMHQFWLERYMPNCRQTVSAGALPDGAAYYRELVRYYTTTEMTPAQIHQLGLDEVTRIRAEMQAIKNTVAFDGDLPAFFKFLRTDSRFYVDDPELYLAKTALVAKRFDEELPKLIGKLPRVPFTIKPYEPEVADRMPAGAAEIAPIGGGGAGVFRINLSRIETRPLFNIVPLTLHEAMPGHHLQTALSLEQDMPSFRRLASFNAYMEGWGLYAEWLGVEAGMYEDPYDDFGRLVFEIWRACRLVVDTGIHSQGWSRQQAIDYMTSNTALSANNIANEVDRYITFPGQATAYKVGQIKIMELRRSAEAALGERFDVRAFHDTVLMNGAVPLGTLQAEVETWIAAQRSAAGDTK